MQVRRVLHTELSELAVGDDESAERPEAFERLLTLLLRGLLLDGQIWLLGVAAANGLRLPDEVLKQVALILGEKQDLRLFDDIAQVGNKHSAFFGQILRGLAERAPLQGGVHCHIDLLVLRCLLDVFTEFDLTTSCYSLMGPCPEQRLQQMSVE